MADDELQTLQKSAVFVGFTDEDREELGFRCVPFRMEVALPDKRTLVLLLDAASQMHGEGQNFWRSALNRIVKNGGTVVLGMGPSVSQSHGSPILQRIQEASGIEVQPLPVAFDLTADEPSMEEFFVDQLSHVNLNVYKPETAPDSRVLAHNTQNQLPASMRVRAGKADIYFVPLKSATGAVDALAGFILSLRPAAAYPAYLDDIEVDSESEVKGAMESHRTALLELQARLEEARARKRILYFSDFELEAEVVRFLNDELHIPARGAGGTDEDLWLLNPDDPSEAWGMGEVKGVGKGNVNRQHLGALIGHLQNAGKDIGYPALLVVNTFSAATKAKERDRAVEPDTIKRAVDDHIMVVRTLDLLRLRALPQDEINRLPAAVREAGGWYEVSDSGDVILHAS